MEIKLQKYDAYKNSGVEWIGEIPEHWDVTNLKNVGLVKNGATPSSSNSKYWDGELVWVTPTDINNIISINNSERKITKLGYANCGTSLVPKGSIILTTRAPIGKVVIADVELCTNQGCKSIVLDERTNSRFLYYQFLINAKLLNGLGTGTTFLELSNKELKNFIVITPNLKEQTAIAKFLDDKTEKIDQAIRVKQEQITFLKERRQVLIHQAVTRGLDQTVKLKDSGVAWIGEIPEGWEVKKIKHVTNKIGSGVTPSGGGNTYLDEGIPLLRSQNIFFGKIELDGVAFISENTHQSMSNSQVFKGDVLLNITGGSIGRCFYVDFDLPMNVNQHVCIIRPNSKITTLYLNSLITSEIGQNQIWFHQQGGGREGLNFQALKNFIIPFPPKKEQIEISEFIHSASNKITNAITLKEKEIEKLKEYKSSLINSVVTGKVKVC